MIRTIAALLLCATPATADVDRVSVLLGSRHVGSAHEMNEFNPGVFLTWDDAVADFDVTAGAYLNSYSEVSVSVTASYDLIEWDGGAAGLFGGAAYYGDAAKLAPIHQSGWIAIGGIQVRHGNAFAQIIPMDGVAMDAVVSFGLTMELGN